MTPGKPQFDSIVIGGGVAGLSTAMQLGKRGQRVLVVERSELGCGSTGNAAGLLGQLRPTRVATKMMMDGLKLVRELEKDLDIQIYIKTGSVRIGQTPARAQEIRDHVAVGKATGFDVQLIDQKKLKQLLPYMKVDDVLEACYSPGDGHIQPAELVAAYTKMGRRLGVQYRTQTPVQKIIIENGAAVGVEVMGEKLYAQAIVNATGLWAPLVGATAGAIVPTAPLNHYYLVTNPLPEVPIAPMSPAVRDRENQIYTRPEVGGLLVGIFESEPTLRYPRELSKDFEMSEMKAARDDIHVAELIDAASRRFPFINPTTPLHIIKGMINYTPDDEPLCGANPDIGSLYHCTGFSHGIAQSPSIGVIMAELVVNGVCPYDNEGIRMDRYFKSPDYSDWDFINQKCFQTCANYYAKINPTEVRDPT